MMIMMHVDATDITSQRLTAVLPLPLYPSLALSTRSLLALSCPLFLPPLALSLALSLSLPLALISASTLPCASVPAGVSTGEHLRIDRGGNAVAGGGQPGHLFVAFRVGKDEVFKRDVSITLVVSHQLDCSSSSTTAPLLLPCC